MRVVVFALRGCPAAAVGPYGNEWAVTPHLDRLAADGAVFDRHVSDCPDPAAAGRAWRTGRHQVPPLPGALPRGGEAADLLAALRGRGVRVAVVRHTRAANDRPPEFYAGWDDLFDARPGPADDPAAALLRVLPAALDRLAPFADWLLWIELDRLLPPWHVPQAVFEAYLKGDDEEDDEPGADDPDEDEEIDDEDDPDVEGAEDEPEEDDEPEGEAEREEAEPVEPVTDPPDGPFDGDDLDAWEFVHTSFAAAVSAFDADLGRVFDLLRDRGLDRDAAWLLTADHGVPLGEHGLVGRSRPWLHEELVHVPLIVRRPAAAGAGRRVSHLTQPADVAATLADWFGAPLPGDGVSLAPLLDGDGPPPRAAAVSGLDLGVAAEWAVRTPEWAFLLPLRPHPDDPPRGPMLFAKPDDRWEVDDRRGRDPEAAAELERVLRAWPGGPGTAAVPAAPPPDAESAAGGPEAFRPG